MSRKQDKRDLIEKHNEEYVKAKAVKTPTTLLEAIKDPSRKPNDIIIVGERESAEMGRREARKLIDNLRERGEIGVTPAGRSVRNRILLQTAQQAGMFGR